MVNSLKVEVIVDFRVSGMIPLNSINGQNSQEQTVNLFAGCIMRDLKYRMA